MKKNPHLLIFVTAAKAAVIMLLVFPLAGASQTAFAQVEIVESYPTIGGKPKPVQSPTANPNQGPITDNSGVRPITDPFGNGNATTAGDLFSQFQQMQLEISQLRGMVEELTNEVKKLKQQRLDDYVELDKRIAQMSGGASAPTVRSPGGATPPSGVTIDNGATATASDSEVESYKNALALALQSKNYDGAIAAFSKHMQEYPSGQYQANALYWLGKIYDLQGKQTEAMNSYSQLVADFPSHDKSCEARYLLGKIHFQQGNKTIAKTLIEEVADSACAEAGSARSYLQANSL